MCTRHFLHPQAVCSALVVQYLASGFSSSRNNCFKLSFKEVCMYSPMRFPAVKEVYYSRRASYRALLEFFADVWPPRPGVWRRQPLSAHAHLVQLFCCCPISVCGEEGNTSWLNSLVGVFSAHSTYAWRNTR